MNYHNFENFNNNNILLTKTLKHLSVPNGFKVKRENVNDELMLKNHFIINNKVIDEKIFIKFYAYIDPNEKPQKKFTKKNKHPEIKKSAKIRKK